MLKAAVIMGSDSDFPKVKNCLEKLKYFGIPFETHVYSAHRTPEEAANFAKNAKKIIIDIEHHRLKNIIIGRAEGGILPPFFKLTAHII